MIRTFSLFVFVLAVSFPMAATAGDITEEEFRKILVADEEWVGNWWHTAGSGGGKYELLLIDNLSIGHSWWDDSSNTPLNIRIGPGTLVYDISGYNRTYQFRYFKDGDSYKLVGTLTGDYRDGSGTYTYDILLRPKK